MTFFYLGDHDPSGRFIEIDLCDQIAAYGAQFEMTRLAIHASDIAAFHLPPQKVKQRDSRSGRFILQYGTDCVELDALPPVELRRRIEQVAQRLWPTERLSRTEICRRFTLAGAQVLPQMSPADQVTMLRRFQMTMLAPDAERLKH
jgi:hypothetical protein